MRVVLWRHRPKLTWIMLPVAITAIIFLLNGSKDAALPLVEIVVLLMVADAVIDWRCKPLPPVLSEDEKASIRNVRDGADLATAVRMLRAAHPDLGLADAAVLVRKL